MIFQRGRLMFEFDLLFAKEIERYSQKMAAVNDDFWVSLGNKRGDLDKLYQMKFEFIKFNYDNSILNIEKDFNKEFEQKMNDIDDFKAQIQEVDLMINQMVNEFCNFFDSGRRLFEKEMEKLHLHFANELNEFYIDNKERYSEATQLHSKVEYQIHVGHSDKMKEIARESKEAQTSKNQSMEMFTQIKTKNSCFRSFLTDLIIPRIDYTSFSEFRNIFKRLLDEFSLNAETIKRLQLEKKAMDKSFNDEIQQNHLYHDDITAKHKMIEKGTENNENINLLELERRFNIMKRESEICNKLESQLDDLYRKYLKIENDLCNGIITSENDVNTLLEKLNDGFISEINILRNKLNDLSSEYEILITKNRKEIEKKNELVLSNVYEMKTRCITKEYFSKLKEDKYIILFNQLHSKISDLHTIKNRKHNEFEDDLNTMKTSNQKSIEKLLKDRKYELDDYIGSLSNDYQNIMLQMKGNLIQQEEELSKVMKSKIETMKKEFEFKLSDNGIGNQAEFFQQIDIEFEKKFNQLLNIFHSISPPIINNPSKVSELQENCLKLEKDLEELNSGIYSEHSFIMETWAELLEGEIKRHDDLMNHQISFLDEKQTIIALKNRILSNKENARIENEKIQYQKEAKIANHNEIMCNLKKIKESSMENSRIAGLMSDLEIMKHRFQILKNEKEYESQDTLNTQKNALKILEQQYINEISHHRDTLSTLKNRFTYELNDEENRIMSLDIWTQNQENIIHENYNSSISQIKKEYYNTKQSIIANISHLKNMIKSNINDFEKEKVEFDSFNNDSIKNLHIDLNTAFLRKKELVGDRLKEYNQRIGYLKEKICFLVDKYDNRPSRQCDLDTINLLKTQLETQTTILKMSIRELAQSRKMLIAKENEYNNRFGRNPNIGFCGYQISSK